jgi:2-oxoglutarate dehydrogenase E2 component (dihydrolipoamide succinyltransferase)
LAEITLPELGETVTEGTITRWLKAVGDAVARDEPLYEVSTDKVDSEVPSPVEGVLTAILVPEGDTVDMGVVLAVISPAGEVAEVPTPEAPTGVAPAGDPARSDPPAQVPAETGTTSGPVSAPVGGAVLSPVVRALLTNAGIDPATLTGTGLGGRITRSDAERAVAGLASGPQTSVSAGTPVAPATGGVPSGSMDLGAFAPPPPGDRDEVVPFTTIRRRTAEHMLASQAMSAHTLMVREVDYESVERIRRSHGERFIEEEGFGLDYVTFVARAAVEALGEFPHLNASVGNGGLIVHRDVNLGVSVDLGGEGAIVPVVHQAEELNLRGMARRLQEVTARAEASALTLDDISGGTFSISNTGPLGTFVTGPIINQPQVAVLSVDGVRRKPVVVESTDGTESIAIHSIGMVAVTFDQRAVDGPYVARFLARVAEILDERDWAGEL